MFFEHQISYDSYHTKDEQTRFEENQLKLQADLMSLISTVNTMTQDHIRLDAEVDKNRELSDLAHRQMSDDIQEINRQIQ